MNPEVMYEVLAIEHRLRYAEPGAAHLRALRAATRRRNGRSAALGPTRLARRWPAVKVRSVA